MSHAPAFIRWRRAVSQAARQVLTARWRSTLDALESARAEYGELYAAAAVDRAAAPGAGARAARGAL